MKATTLKQLAFINWITNKDIQEVMNKATYYNIINWETNPTNATIKKMCELFKIELNEFTKLLKNTLKTLKNERKNN